MPPVTADPTPAGHVDAHGRVPLRGINTAGAALPGREKREVLGETDHELFRPS